MRFTRRLAAIILTGVFVRLAVAFVFSYPYDFHSWALIISNFEAGNGLYDVAGYNYAPPWGYILGFLSEATGVAGVDVLGIYSTDFLFMEEARWSSTAFVTSLGFNMAFEILLMAFDLATAFIIYGFVEDRTGDVRKAENAFALWFLCPFVIVVTCIGGMFDGLCAMLTVLCMLFVMKGDYLLAGSMIATATLLKLFPAFLVFLLIGYVLCSHRDRREAIRCIVVAVSGALVTVLVLLLPQILDGTVLDCFCFITARAHGGMGNGLGTAVSMTVIAIYILIIVLSFLIGRRMAAYKGEDRDRMFFRMMSLNVAVLFLCPATPQYILLLAPFLILLMVLDGNRDYRTAYLMLCIGTSMSVCTSIVPSMESVAVFSGLLDVDWLIAAIGVWTAEWHGISLASVLSIGAVIQYAATLLVLYRFWQDDFGGALPGRRHPDASEL